MTQADSLDSRNDLWIRMQRIELIVLDVDGVLTNGQVIYGHPELEIKCFHVRDGSGLKIWRDQGKKVALISGRSSPSVDRRAHELGITPVLQGRGNKGPALQEIVQRTGVPTSQICAIGDDLPDLPVLRACGVSVAVADACSELRAMADHTTQAPGGSGAVRETIEWLLKAQGRWQAVIDSLNSIAG
ncbi:KdsC family phosphatase [Tuwongella immobilis]|uniref:Phenylphosphate carboxylase subunit delta n=1 Tax=Tuwongella immobilis TaxID=692036 RepID=A0A6C2YM43_9BACT|nr:HAD hydrolase family protein [Tuwongella immobilis]VIP02434.1 3-deoxy-d-manno-octulosonate 8-phosphate phosphatase : Phosphatase kdsC OS=Blastopirellula marina DSM 3645 GN=DSM3645_09012 PE=4 SV=1: Hydrolase_3 [Tuwongella immobilis]VTS01386.1 3-deoxy-d-manno-octulosonate 8-phosphate phosphatase : Phosphatase kdsC OS=Blastopirellula marina DSM 3645 GN=DSM3645_09012 PE=4 SV=1: Hydrolase_3 [Tuwongella immobilis]